MPDESPKDESPAICPLCDSPRLAALHWRATKRTSLLKPTQDVVVVRVTCEDCGVFFNPAFLSRFMAARKVTALPAGMGQEPADLTTPKPS